MKTNGRSAEGRMHRQKILNHLNLHPNSLCADLAKAVGATPKQTVARLAQMRRNNEVLATEIEVGNNKLLHYTALVKKTMDSYPPVADGALPLWSTRAKAPAKVDLPGRITNKCDDSRPPHQNQRCQGAVMVAPRVGTVLAVGV